MNVLYVVEQIGHEIVTYNAILLNEMESQQAPIIMAPRTNQEEIRDVYRK